MLSYESSILYLNPPLQMTVANGVLHTPVFGRFSVEKQESLLKISILSIAAVLAFSTRLFSVLR